MAVLNDKSRLLISASGIFVSYFIFGMLQEKVTRGRYGSEENDDGTIGERFTFTLALVGVQCLFNWLFVKGKLTFLSHKTANKSL
jgi:solute carrier family 35 (UDP-galactose transporter), member B1